MRIRALLRLAIVGRVGWLRDRDSSGTARENAPPSPVAETAPAAAPAQDAAASTGRNAMPPDSAAAPAVPAAQPPANEPAVGTELAPPAQAQPAAPPSPKSWPTWSGSKPKRAWASRAAAWIEYQGVLVTPAKAYFSVRERLVFEDQIPKAVNYSKPPTATAPSRTKTSWPRSSTPIRSNCRELPAGQRYVYDPEKEELMVERPAR